MRLSAIWKKCICLLVLCGFSLAVTGCGSDTSTPAANSTSSPARKRTPREPGTSDMTPGAETSAPPENEKDADKAKE